MTMPPPLEAASAELVSTCGEITRISDFGCKDGVSDEPQGQVELENKKAMIACNESNDTPPSNPVLPAAAGLKRKRGRPTKEESALRAQAMALHERSTRATIGKRKRGRPRKEEDVQAQSKLSFPSRARKPTCGAEKASKKPDTAGKPGFPPLYCGGSRREEACNTVNTTTTERPADDSDFRAEVKQLRLAQERQLEIITEQTLNIYKLNAEQSRQGSEIRQLKQELQASRQPPCGDKEKEGEEDDDVDQPLVRTLAKLLYCMDKLFEHIFTRRMRTSDRFLSDIRVELGDERIGVEVLDCRESKSDIRRQTCMRREREDQPSRQTRSWIGQPAGRPAVPPGRTGTSPWVGPFEDGRVPRQPTRSGNDGSMPRHAMQGAGDAMGWARVFSDGHLAQEMLVEQEERL
ncbi:hypothetical protein IWX49DRAFT_557069 [Phyllosticta citricarpa]